MYELMPHFHELSVPDYNDYLIKLFEKSWIFFIIGYMFNVVDFRFILFLFSVTNVLSFVIVFLDQVLTVACEHITWLMAGTVTQETLYVQTSLPWEKSKIPLLKYVFVSPSKRQPVLM